jgi:hypothetical protein
MLPSVLPEPQPTKPQVQRFVSVFELDSDSETEVDKGNNSFAKRIARGLHKMVATHLKLGNATSNIK